jgi:hypothetical protein
MSESLQLAVAPDRALDAFYHPYAYASLGQDSFAVSDRREERVARRRVEPSAEAR